MRLLVVTRLPVAGKLPRLTMMRGEYLCFKLPFWPSSMDYLLLAGLLAATLGNFPVLLLE